MFHRTSYKLVALVVVLVGLLINNSTANPTLEFNSKSNYSFTAPYEKVSLDVLNSIHTYAVSFHKLSYIYLEDIAVNLLDAKLSDSNKLQIIAHRSALPDEVYQSDISKITADSSLVDSKDRTVLKKDTKRGLNFLKTNSKDDHPESAEMFAQDREVKILSDSVQDVNSEIEINKPQQLVFESTQSKKIAGSLKIQRNRVGVGQVKDTQSSIYGIQPKGKPVKIGTTVDGKKYLKDKFIVKFKTTGKHAVKSCAQCLLAHKEKFLNHVMDQSDSLDRLNQKYQIKKARNLFMNRHGLNNEEAKYKQQRILAQSIAVRPYRSKRAEQLKKPAEIPDLTASYVMDLPEGSDIEEVCRQYSKDEHVEYAHPVYLYSTRLNPNDTYADADQDGNWSTGAYGQSFEDLWGVRQIKAEQAFDIEQGNGVIVAVVDTGLDYNHPDISANVWSNSGEVVDGVDNDGNGYIDDIRGFDFTTCNAFDLIFGFCTSPKLADNDPMDGNGHGTHVSGTIGSVVNNAQGIVGIAPQVQIMPLRSLNDQGLGTIDELAEGIVYAAINGADVINNSWGGPCLEAPFSDPTAEAAVDTAFGLGVVVVFAAGNETEDTECHSPQNMSETITVAASTTANMKADFSNFGGELTVSAPGVDILSLNAQGGNNTIALTSPELVVDTDYLLLEGTSMASPHVAGVAALILGQHPELTNVQVKLALQGTADDIDAPGFDENTGFGLVNALEAVTLDRVKPVIATIGDKTTDSETLLQFTVTASDPNSDTINLNARLSDSSALSTIGAAFTDNGDDTGTFSWTPSSAQQGIDFAIVFTATDSPDGFSDTETITITVNSTTPVCGNGTVETGEECDDGNTTSGDGCSSICIQEFTCGDGVLEVGEQCDDGNTSVGDGCNDNCQLEVCGNGTVDFGEECDDGNTSAGDGCDDSCLSEVCGNGRVDFGEECDDSNTTAGDGCSASCTIEVCGNGTVDFGEECDDGNTTSGDGCTNLCQDEFCGDGTVNNGSEQCDDGNTSSGDGCSSACTIEVCGNGTVDFGEECDDGNTASGDGCSSSCITEECGNQIIDPGEVCDDGNTNEVDGCTNSCQIGPVCGNGQCQSGETFLNCFQDCVPFRFIPLN